MEKREPFFEGEGGLADVPREKGGVIYFFGVESGGVRRETRVGGKGGVEHSRYRSHPVSTIRAASAVGEGGGALGLVTDRHTLESRPGGEKQRGAMPTAPNLSPLPQAWLPPSWGHRASPGVGILHDLTF
ncbi:hypothetical protein E2C01_070636 [Portunus trituberculatus]|uniref:Uncharacterized protein n=1 Tax=Portunus trituberculatus TaxID=210409 RepID=A0A5B7I2T2_PORTR|nr:hypothetical protein [Portunus trituberculatus]